MRSLGKHQLNDTASLRLDEVAAHNVLHKIVRPWMVGGQSVDVLLFDDIGVFACVNYEDGKMQDALDFIHAGLGIRTPKYLEVPFNVLKRWRPECRILTRAHRRAKASAMRQTGAPFEAGSDALPSLPARPAAL